MDRREFVRRLALFFSPIAAGAAFLFAFGTALPQEMRPIFVVLILGYFMTPLGREVLIPLTAIALLQLHGSAHMVTDIALIVTCIVFVDVICSIFLLWNLDLLKRIPKIGKWIARMEEHGRRKLMRSRNRRTSMFLALTAYMASPFYGSHGVASTIIGMLSGMRKARIWLAIWIGSLTGALSVSAIAFTAGQYVLLDIFDNSVWKAVSITVGISIFICFIWNYRAQAKWDESGRES